MTSRLSMTAVEAFPMVHPGDDLADLIMTALKANGIILEEEDILVIAQKVFSKAEDRYLDLNTVSPSPEARATAAVTGHDPRFVQAVLDDSERVVRKKPNVLITRHRLGFVMANAGLDQSNIDDADNQVLRLPEDPDASARRLRDDISDRLGVLIGVVINDSFGRPWRIGTCGTAIGVAGIQPIDDRRGGQDLNGRTLVVTEIAVADELAAGASLLMGGAAEGRPVVHVRGWKGADDGRGAEAIVRDVEGDLFL